MLKVHGRASGEEDRTNSTSVLSYAKRCDFLIIADHCQVLWQFFCSWLTHLTSRCLPNAWAEVPMPRFREVQ
jgi:hypothetical protein